jgi:predicted NAD/FAD-dependent oxidoreductase
MAHVGVVGGGLAGAMAALVLRSRGLRCTVIDAGRRGPGGRLGGGQHPDSGAQFLHATDRRSQWGAVLAMLEREGIVAPWNGRFGLCGSKGGFLPRAVLGALTTSLPEQAEGDFCNFLTASEHPLYVGTPANQGICAAICTKSGAEVVSAATVHALKPLPDQRGWTVQIAAASGAAGGADRIDFDAVVLASHDASLAASAISEVVERVGGGDADVDDDVARRLGELRTRLVAQRQTHTAPLFSWSAYFPQGFSEHVPFDAASVLTSASIHFVSRHASKPGRPAVEDAGELWTAVSTPTLARSILHRHADGGRGSGAQAEHEAAALMSVEAGRLFAPFFGGEADAVPPPASASAKRWSAALPSQTLDLLEDCVSFEPWRLAVAGDFIRAHTTPAESAAMSGLEAGERVASWFGQAP